MRTNASRISKLQCKFKGLTFKWPIALLTQQSGITFDGLCWRAQHRQNAHILSCWRSALRFDLFTDPVHCVFV
ncbi:hypothetical protein C7964_10512 [Loktanella sp. PT4BL]|jgi:hypothetical protein|nr:hypothetical protein C7964_10512 [Loktanella sp. PT4BL]